MSAGRARAAKSELPCEYAARMIFPSVRALIAKTLINEYSMTKYQIAKVLGITPAAVTYYVYGKRGDKYARRIESSADLKPLVKRAAKLLVEMSEEAGPESFEEYQHVMCGICSNVNEVAHERGCPAIIYLGLGRNQQGAALRCRC